ncbi:DUF7520 family protein [Salinigranum salinum]|uniref:DUF7520 family protein n=1 Tax=Salinigranum salinum TaxID=1364937 RepID=UPI001F03B96F|nr:hypothetical protein [Salinigranum salinum]
MNDTAAAADEPGRRLGGKRFVVGLYLALVAVSGLLGVLFTTAVDDPSPPALFFLVELPPTAVGFGLYGAVTVAVVLGVPLLFVVLVSALVDDPDAVGRADFEGPPGVDSDAARRGDSAGEGDSTGGRGDHASEGDSGESDATDAGESTADAASRSTESPKD